MELDMKEIWKPIPRYKGLYEVSNMGRVRRACDSWRRACKKGHILSFKLQKGYARIHLHKNGGRKVYSIHRLVLKSFIGPCPKGLLAGHLNDIKTDNRLENLAWMTPSENQKLSFINGRIAPKARDHPMFGKYHSNESRRKMSLARLGKKHSKQTKEKISIGLRKYYG